MRIISGLYGGRKLQTPKDNAIRPTSDKIRGSIFNMLASRMDLDDTVVLDLFCGTGALGLEALSRGAAACSFIDAAKPSLDLARDNAHCLGVQDQCMFIKADSCTYTFDTGIRADLFFCDPPYREDLIIPTLENLRQTEVLKSGAIGVLESEKVWRFPEMNGFRSIKDKVYGDTVIHLVLYQSGDI